MKLSILLPSLYPEALSHAVANIEAATRGVSYEIVVVSPFEVAHPKVTWAREEQGRGCCAAFETALARASGDYVALMTDDSRLTEGWAEIALADAAEGESRNAIYCLGLHQTNLIVGTAFGIYYPFFPFIRRTTLAAVGGLFDLSYIAHYPDVDLGFRVWHAGGRCEHSSRPVIERVARRGNETIDITQKASSRAGDHRTFVTRWKSIFAPDWPGEDLSNVNIDVDPFMQMSLKQGRTIFMNIPHFQQLFINYQNNIAYSRDHPESFEARPIPSLPD